MNGSLLSAIDGGLRIFDLARPMAAGMPQSPNHPQFRMALVRRHGDVVRDDGGSAASELIITGGHVGTHIDALSHVSHEGRLHGELDAAEAQRGGRFTQLGVETIPPMICRGWLLDVPAALGIDACPPAYEITPADLERAAEAQNLGCRTGDAVLVRSGWARRWEDPEAYVGHASGVPGPGEPAARWLAGLRPRAVGADTIAFEHLPAGAGHARLPAHRVLLVEHGIHIVETLNLESLAEAGIHEFAFVLVPLALVGATGSPVRPLAIVASGEDAQP